MKGYMLKIVIQCVLLTFYIQTSTAQWQSVEPPKGSKINSISKLGSDVIAVTDSGLFSFESQTGQMIKYPLNDVENVSANCIFEKDNSIFIGTKSSGILRSNDGGDTWYFINNNMDGELVYSFSFIDDILYAFTNNGVYYSSNNGTNWEKKNFSSTRTYYSTTKIDTLLLIASSKGLYQSFDTLETISSAGISGKILSLKESSGDIILLSALEGVKYSSDTAQIWIQKNGDLPIDELTSLDFRGDTIFSSTSDSIFFSSDKGNTWDAVYGYKDININSLYIDNTSIYAGSRDNLIYSGDFGTNWTVVNKGFPDKVMTNKLMLDSCIYGRTSDMTIYKKYPSGDWQYYCMPENNSFKVNKYIQFDTVFFASGSKTYISFDTLKTWTMVSDQSLDNFIFKGDTILATSYPSKGVYRSIDRGGTWLESNIGLELCSTPHIFEFDSQIYFNNTCSKYYKTNDLGDTWQYVGDSLFNLDIAEITSKNNIHIATTFWGGAFLYNSLNDTWESLSDNWLENIAIGNDTNNIFGTITDGIYIYSGNQNWRRVSGGLNYYTQTGSNNGNSYSIKKYVIEDVELIDSMLYGFSKGSLFKRNLSDCLKSIDPPEFYDCYTDRSGEVVNVRFNLNWKKSTNNEVTDYEIRSTGFSNTFDSNITSCTYNSYNSDDVHTIEIYASVNGDNSLPTTIKLTSMAGDSTNFTAITSVLSDNNITFYPNPTKGKVFVDMKSVRTPISLAIFDIRGQQLFYKNEFSENAIDLSDFPKGVYFLQVTSDSGHKIISKLVKE